MATSSKLILHLILRDIYTSLGSDYHQLRNTGLLLDQGRIPTNKETRLSHRLVRAVGQFWSGSVPGGRVSPVVMDVIIVTSDIVTLIHSVYSTDSHPHTDLHCQLFTIFQVSTGIAL